MAAGHGPEIALEPVLTPEQLQRGTRAVDDFKLYLRDLVARRSREQHLEEGEILSKLIAASELSPDGGSGERVTDLELLHNCIFILNAAHETTTSLIGNGVDFLIPIRTPCGSCARIPN
jgi:cytochrome P450